MDARVFLKAARRPLILRSGRTTAEVEAVGRPLEREKVGKPLRLEAVG